MFGRRTLFGADLELIVSGIAERKRRNALRAVRRAAPEPVAPGPGSRRRPRPPGVRLVESKRPINQRRFLRVGSVSLGIHTAVIVGAVYTTLHAERRDTTVRLDTTLVFLDVQQRRPPEQAPVPLDVPLRGFQTVVVPTDIPTNIPPVDLQERFDVKDYSGTGVEGGHAEGFVPEGDQVYTEDVVEERPALRSAPPPYPRFLEQAGIQGRVLLEAVVDTTGRIVPSSIRIIESSNPGFDQPTTQWALRAVFRPARMQGRAVRVLVTLPIVYQPARP